MLSIAHLFIGHMLLDIFDDCMTLLVVIRVSFTRPVRVNLCCNSWRAVYVCPLIEGQTARDTSVGLLFSSDDQ